MSQQTLAPENLQDALKKLQEHRLETDRQASPTAAQLALLYQQQWLRAFIPRAYGGLEMPYPEALSLFEALARADSNIGWLVNLGAGANFFAGFLEPSLAEAVFRPQGAWLAGNGMPRGEARKAGDGYRLSGEWPYNSGATWATAFTFSCRLPEEQDRVLAALVFPEEVSIRPDWQSMGLRATAGHSVRVADAPIPPERFFDLGQPKPQVAGPLYRLPFMTFARLNMAVMMTGTALRFLEEAQALLAGKGATTGGDTPAGHRLAGARYTLESNRDHLFRLADQVWHTTQSQGSPSPALEEQVAQSVPRLSEACLAACQRLYPLLGMRVLRPDEPLNLSWRDLHTISQHALLAPAG